MQTLVTGITGYVGGQLVGELERAGHAVRGLARNPARYGGDPRVPVVRGDLSTGAGLDAALEDVGLAYYLVHSMEGTKNFILDEQRGAERFARAAAKAGVPRIVYMSVLTPQHPPFSAHVRSRIAVEHELSSHGAEVIALRASIAIGSQSRSFRFLVRLVERFPVLLLPPWRDNRTMPIDERDLLAALLRAATATVDRPLSVFDAVGPDVVSYQQLTERIRDHLLIARPVVPFPFALTALTAPLAAAVAGEDLGLVQPLMASLGSDLLPRTPDPHEVDLGRPKHDIDAAIEHALRPTHDHPEEGA